MMSSAEQEAQMRGTIRLLISLFLFIVFSLSTVHAQTVDPSPVPTPDPTPAQAELLIHDVEQTTSDSVGIVNTDQIEPSMPPADSHLPVDPEVIERPNEEVHSARRDMEVLDEAGLYEQMELFRLSRQAQFEKWACMAMIRRFPQSNHVDQARFRLVMIDLYNPLRWDRRVDALLKYAEENPHSPYASHAQAYYRALTEPQDAFDLLLLRQIYRTTAYGDLNEEMLEVAQSSLTETSKDKARSMLVENAPKYREVSEIFLINRVANFYERLPLRDWIRDDSQMNRLEKSFLIFDLAEMMFRFPGARRLDDCEAMIGWMDEYSDSSLSESLAMTLKSHVLLKKDQLEAADKTIMATVQHMGGLEQGRELMIVLAQAYYKNSRYKDAARLVGQVQCLSPSQKNMDQISNILSRSEMAGLVDQWKQESDTDWTALGKKLAAADEKVWPVLADCGPFAFLEVSRRLGSDMTHEEAQQKCVTNSKGTSSFGDLYRSFLKEDKYEVYAVQVEFDDLNQLAGEPDTCVVLHLPDHFKLLQKSDNNGYQLFDATGTSSFSSEHLNILWDRYALIIKKKSV